MRIINEKILPQSLKKQYRELRKIISRQYPQLENKFLDCILDVGTVLSINGIKGDILYNLTHNLCRELQAISETR